MWEEILSRNVDQRGLFSGGVHQNITTAAMARIAGGVNCPDLPKMVDDADYWPTSREPVATECLWARNAERYRRD